MSSWRDSLAIHLRPRLLAVLFMGFGSGLPLPLTFGTLTFWLAESGVNRTTIGLLALVGTAYSLKFLWAPLVDRMPLGPLTARLGRRRGWALGVQALLVLAILALGTTDPRIDPLATAAAALAIAFLSATQDIVVDALRIELLAPEEQGAGAAATQWGYRFGMIVSSAGALYAAEFGGWGFAFCLMAGFMAVGMAAVWLAPEPSAPTSPQPRSADAPLAARAWDWIRGAAIDPFREFMGRPGWAAILVFVVLYKFGDALAGTMANPFYVAMGFTRIEVANISKVFGVVATLAGVAAGGVLVHRQGLARALVACGVLQALSNLMYALQAMVGHDVLMLAATIGIENFTGGMGSAAFVAYLSGLCNVAYTATQYALLSSLAAVGRTTLSAGGGWLSLQLDWVLFFAVTTLAALPGIAMAIWVMRRFPPRREGEA
ncbi:MAG: AmpG family muropeptide MFS transporter [Alphaproteobacteria bacterium]|nr:AmpG family muropeptide MFS transporter [Alphaproteobacteria bacterium]MBM3629777.1 AmpG family muropeptide MFS transporter [Alphaproteobacteria bacterium]